MKMHVLSGGRVRMKKHIYVPDSARDETLDLPVHCFLIRHSQGNVLFDTGCHPSVAEDAEARWGALAKVMVPVMGAEDNVVDELATVGLGADDIDVVVNSHFHTDHCGCNEFFTNATMIVHTEELKKARDPESEGQGYYGADWDQANEFDTLDAQRDLFGDERIVLLPLPGHSPGLTGALVNLEISGSFLLTSDAAALEKNLNPDVMPKNMWDVDQSIKSLAEIRKIQSQGATVIFGHDVDQWAGLKKGADAYD